MRAIFTIAGKDLKNLLKSPIFYVIGGLCAVIWSNSYIRVLLKFVETSMLQGPQSGMNLQRDVFTPHISLVNLLLIFVIPALTMRLLAEEKRQRTYDLLLTSPITSTQIVLGKFLAGVAAVAILILISLLYPLVTFGVANFPLLPLFSAYFGLLLVATCYVAVGIFASSLTESVVLSVIMALIFNIMLWFIGQGAEGGEGVNKILEHLAIAQHFFNFIMGSIKLKSLVFFLSVVGLFVFLTQRVVESSRWR